MTFLVILLVMLAAFTVVGWPLVSSARAAGRESDEASPLNDLISRQDAAYRAIKELDFEYQLGNLSESDYRGLRKRYRSEAAAALRELDTAMREAGASEASSNGPPIPATVAPAASAQADPPCPSCGGPTEARDHYCRSCGARLEAEA
jgi:predicted RNA-binding Zn-ribbon protein involved in translation (DUF1610 family)